MPAPTTRRRRCANPHCQELAKYLTKGRCYRCNAFLSKHGVERREDLVRQHYVERARKGAQARLAKRDAPLSIVVPPPTEPKVLRFPFFGRTLTIALEA